MNDTSQSSDVTTSVLPQNQTPARILFMYTSGCVKLIRMVFHIQFQTPKPVCSWLHTAFYDFSHSFPSNGTCCSPDTVGREVVLHYTELDGTGFGEIMVKYSS